MDKSLCQLAKKSLQKAFNPNECLRFGCCGVGVTVWDLAAIRFAFNWLQIYCYISLDKLLSPRLVT